MADLVPLCQPADPLELGMIRRLLESEGIVFYINNENYGSLYALPSIGHATMTVMVDASMLEEAQELLAERLDYTF